MEQKCEKRQEWVELGQAQCQCWWWNPAPALQGHLALARQDDSLWNLTLGPCEVGIVHRPLLRGEDAVSQG